MLFRAALRLGLWTQGCLSLSGEQLENLAPHEKGDTILQVKCTNEEYMSLNGAD